MRHPNPRMLCSPLVDAGADVHMPSTQHFLQASQPTLQEAFPVSQSLSLQMAAIASPSADWRCMHGNIVVPAASPAITLADATGCRLHLQWPTVLHASAYVVDLLDQGTMTSQQFTRAHPEGPLPTLMDLCVDCVGPSSYAAHVRCVAPCGCVSNPSAWSVLLGFPVPAAIRAPSVAPTALEGLPCSCPPPPIAPPSFPSAHASLAALPPVPEGTADQGAEEGEDILLLD